MERRGDRPQGRLHFYRIFASFLQDICATGRFRVFRGFRLIGTQPRPIADCRPTVFGHAGRVTLPSVATARPATSRTACQRSMTRSLPQSTSNYTQIRRARIKRDGSFVGRLTTEYTETPLATRIWLEKSRRSHFSNPLPCQQSGFRDFRGCKSMQAVLFGVRALGCRLDIPTPTTTTPSHL